jgi:hypothetical protein
MADTSITEEIITSEQVDIMTITQAYQTEHKLTVQLQQEMHELKQKLLIEQKNANYWREKSLKLQIDLGLANFELHEYQGTKKPRDVKKLEDKLGKGENKIYKECVFYQILTLILLIDAI